jgi:UDP-glucose 4-epimerase
MRLLSHSSKIVLTGGSGFLGTHLLNNEAFQEALAIGRTQPRNHQYFQTVSFDVDDNLTEVFNDKEVVVHVAARAHVMDDTAKSPLDEFRHVNTFGTLNLAKQAAIAGVKRFIFISTIKVLGEKTEPGQPFKCDDSFNPQDPYSISKVEAEVGLKLIGESYGMEIVIIRPPLVYGQGVKGNFASLLTLARLPIPLPFGSIQNKRSLVSVENLVDLIVICLNHPNAKNQTFLVSDDVDMSTPILFSRLSEAGGYKPYIFRFPVALLSIALRVLGKLSIYERLCGSMQIDIEYTKSQLSWKPPFKVKDSLSNCWLIDTGRQKGFQK